MAASINDKLRKYKSLFSTTLSTGIGTGTSDTITPATVTGLPTDTAITLTIDRVDSSGIATPSKLERIKGIISGGNLIDYVRGVDGTTEQSHTAGAVVEMVWNAADLNDIVDWGLVEHSQLGVHDKTKVVDLTTAQTLTNKTLSTGSKLDANADSNFTYNSLSRQAIINGNFDVWQRGTTSTNPATSVLLADRWKTTISYATPPTNVVHSRQALTPGDLPGSFYHYRIAPDGAGTDAAANFYALRQFVEHGTRLLCGAGKKVTLSFYARSSIANKKIGVFAAQNYGTTGSPTSTENIDGTNWTLTSTWTKYTHTFTTNTLVSKTFGTDNNDFFLMTFLISWGSNNQTNVGASASETFVGSGNIDIAQVQLCAGDVALPFQPKSFEEELRACQRYYEKSYDYAVAPGTNTYLSYAISQVGHSTSGQRMITVMYRVRKRIAITPTYYDKSGTLSRLTTYDSAGGSETNNVTSDAIYANGEVGFSIYKSGTTVGGIACHWVADAEL